MSREPWFILAARNALEEGFRCVAARLNEVLDEKAKGLQIAADQPTADDSFRHAQEAMRRALPGLRTVMEIPAHDAQVTPWTLGYVNDKGNPPLVLSVDAVSCDLIDDAIQLLRTSRETWRREHWETFIVQPVESHMEELRQSLGDINAPYLVSPPKPIAKDILPKRDQITIEVIRQAGYALTAQEIGAAIMSRGYKGGDNSANRANLANMARRGILIKQEGGGYFVAPHVT